MNLVKPTTSSEARVLRDFINQRPRAKRETKGILLNLSSEAKREAENIWVNLQP